MLINVRNRIFADFTSLTPGTMKCVFVVSVACVSSSVRVAKPPPVVGALVTRPATGTGNRQTKLGMPTKQVINNYLSRFHRLMEIHGSASLSLDCKPEIAGGFVFQNYCYNSL